MVQRPPMNHSRGPMIEVLSCVKFQVGYYLVLETELPFDIGTWKCRATLYSLKIAQRKGFSNAVFGLLPELQRKFGSMYPRHDRIVLGCDG